MPEGRVDQVRLARLRKALKPIVFLTSGTRGDVQPIAALARGMQDAGRTVRLVAPPAFRNLVEAHSIPYAELQGNPSELLANPGRQSALTFNDNPLTILHAVQGFLREARPVYSQMISNGWKVSRDASALVIGLPTLWGTSISESLRIPCIGAFLQPVTPTVQFPSALWPTSLRLGRFYNRLTYWLSSRALFLPWRAVINNWRTGTLGLSPLPPLHDFLDSLTAILYGFSETVVHAPSDWQGSNFITGYWMPKQEDVAPTDDLKEFLGNGEPPFYFGFGSPGMHSAVSLMKVITKAIDQLKIRAVIAMPGETSHLVPKSPEVYLLTENVPHTWLFPRMAGLVHHGGAGTTAAAIRSGIPSLVTPLAVDQFFWGERVCALGAGPPPIPQRSLTPKKLIYAIKGMQAEGIREASRLLGDKLKAEEGIEVAVHRLVSLLEDRSA
jgi:sterol 3beta-glucosyltransferase